MKIMFESNLIFIVSFADVLTKAPSLVQDTREEGEISDEPKNICRHYRMGQCNYGSTCRYAHVDDPGAPSSNTNPISSPSSITSPSAKTSKEKGTYLHSDGTSPR